LRNRRYRDALALDAWDAKMRERVMKDFGVEPEDTAAA
jgi:hypothetical protein